MELLYLWIEDFRKIKKQGFDFSAEFKFQVIERESSSNKKYIDYTLVISRNEGFVNLFDGNIINVTGIIGKNASGKSTLLHCLKLMTGKLSILVCPLIFCLLDHETRTIKTYYYNGGGIEDMAPLNVAVESDKDVNKKYKISQAKAYTIDRFGISGSKVKGLDFDFSSIASCFFSNTFDSHRENIYEGIQNISTNYKIESFLNEYIASKENAAKKVKEKNPKLEIWPSHILQFHKLELKGLLKFLSYANTRKINGFLTLPKTLNIEFKFDDYEYLINSGKEYFLFDKNDIKEIYDIAFSIVSQSLDMRANFMNLVLITSFFHVLRKDLLQPKVTSMDETRNLIKSISKKPKDIFIIIRKVLSPLSQYRDYSIKNKTISDFLGNAFEKNIQNLNFSTKEKLSNSKIFYQLKIENSLWSVLSLIFDLQVSDDASYMDYSWGEGLSTGQEAFLTHFARLYNLKTKLGTKPIWLLIDEGDLYFHPEWQKKYFSELLDYVKFLFPKNKVQIIITTHSPFIVSDLPKQNLIFLKQDAEGMCCVANNDIQFETFGSNIHELFTNSFFLEGGLIGKFAKEQIQEIFDWCKKTSKEGHLNIRNKINIIGEPIIRVKLAEMYAQKMGENIEESRLEEQIKILTKKLKDLEKK